MLDDKHPRCPTNHAHSEAGAVARTVPELSSLHPDRANEEMARIKQAASRSINWTAVQQQDGRMAPPANPPSTPAGCSGVWRVRARRIRRTASKGLKSGVNAIR